MSTTLVSSNASGLVAVGDGHVTQQVLRKEGGGSEGKRAQWGSSWEFTLICIGFSVGLGNVWRFPYLCYKNGGGAFLFPYLILMLFVGIPLLFLEFSMGQYYGMGGLQLYNKFCPLIKGLGISLGIMNYMVNTYYSVIIAVSIYYFFHSFHYTLPWASCSNKWNTPACVYDQGTAGPVVLPFNSLVSAVTEQNRSLSGNLSTPAEEFYRYGMLNETADIDISNIGEIRWKLFGCLVLAWLLVCVFLFNGIKSSGKVALLASTFPYLMLTVLVARGVTLAGAMDGLKYFLVPDWSRMLDPNIWFDAATQLFFASNIAWGGMISMASYNQFNYPLMRDAIAINVVNFLTSLYAGLAVFSVIGFMAQEMGKNVEDVIKDGPGLVFVVYPHAISLMRFSGVLSAMFFFMIFLLGIDSMMVCCETVVAGLCDHFPLLQKYHFITLVSIAASSLLVSTTMVTQIQLNSFFLQFAAFLTSLSQGGMYVLTLLDTYSVGYVVFLFAFVEVTFVNWNYGTHKLALDIKKMTYKLVSFPWRFSWKFSAPVFIFLIFVVSLLKYKRVRKDNQLFPIWADVVGWSIAGTIAAPLLLIAVYVYYCTDATSVIKKLSTATKREYGLDENEALVLLVDVGPSTSPPVKGECSGLDASIDSVCMILDRKLFSESQDKVALILCGTTEPHTAQSPLSLRVVEAPEGANNIPSNVTLAAPLDVITADLVEFIKHDIQPNTEQIGDLGVAIMYSANYLTKTMSGCRGFSSKRIVLFADSFDHLASDNLDEITAKLKENNISFDVIGPKTIDTSSIQMDQWHQMVMSSKRMSLSESESSRHQHIRPSISAMTHHKRMITSLNKFHVDVMISLVLESVNGDHASMSDTIPALHYFKKSSNRSIAWKCDLEITELLSILVCCYTSVVGSPSGKLKNENNHNDVTQQASFDDISTISFSASDDKAMKALTSNSFKTVGFTSCDNLNRIVFMEQTTMVIFADKSDKKARLAFSVLVNALEETANAMIVRRIYSNDTMPTIGSLVPYVTNECECLIFNELPFPDDALRLTFSSLKRQISGSFLGRKKSRQQLSVTEKDLVAELIANTDASSSLKNAYGAISEGVSSSVLTNQLVLRLQKSLRRPSFNPDRPHLGMLATLNTYAGLERDNDPTLFGLHLKAQSRVEKILTFLQLKDQINANQNARSGSSLADLPNYQDKDVESATSSNLKVDKRSLTREKNPPQPMLPPIDN